jgi:fucose permease
MALGRYALGAVTEAIGLHTAVSVYIAVACCAQFLLMALHQIAGNLVVLGVCGFFLAPLFPSGIVTLSDRTPIQDRTEVIAAVIAMGQVGVAIVPYAMGLLATHLGTQYLLHVTLGLSVVLLVLWIAISRFEETREAVESMDSGFTASGSIVD